MTTPAYSRTTKTFHWLTAALIFAIIPLGFVTNDAPFATDAEIARKTLLFSLHKTLGIAVFIVAVARYHSCQPTQRSLTFLADCIGSGTRS